MNTKIRKAISLGLSEEEALYIDSCSEKTKQMALDLMSSLKTLSTEHRGLNYTLVFPMEEYARVANEKLLQIIAEAYDLDRETTVGRICRTTWFMKKSFKRSILDLLFFPLQAGKTNATKQAAIKMLLRS